MVGAKLVMPGRFLQAEGLCKLITSERPTFSGAVPTIWSDILRYAETHPADFSSFRMVVCGGSAVPRVLMERFEERHGRQDHPVLGDDRDEPARRDRARPARRRGGRGDGLAHEDRTDRARRRAPDRRRRTAEELPWDGESVGEIEVRGPWITGAYYRDSAAEKFHDGWLRTGDVG